MKPKAKIFFDQYEVSLDYKAKNGYWVMNHKEHISIPLVGKFAKNEKAITTKRP